MGDLPGTGQGVTDGLFERARAGDEAAWRELLAQCYEKVRRVVRHRLDPPMRSLYDSTDIANDVFASLVAKSERFRFETIDELRAYLVHAAQQKVIDEYRRQHRGRRDIRRGRHLGALEADDEAGPFDPAGRDPTPSQHAVAREAQEQILNDHAGLDRHVLEGKAQGYSNEEMAEETGLHLRKVQRLVKKAFDSWSSRAGGRS